MTVHGGWGALKKVQAVLGMLSLMLLTASVAIAGAQPGIPESFCGKTDLRTCDMYCLMIGSPDKGRCIQDCRSGGVKCDFGKEELQKQAAEKEAAKTQARQNLCMREVAGPCSRSCRGKFPDKRSACLSECKAQAAAECSAGAGNP